MGGYLPDVNVAGLLEQLNLRFGPKAAIEEMAAIQKEFGVFSEEHSLVSSFKVLNMGPTNNWSHRRGWHKYLNDIGSKPALINGADGATKGEHPSLVMLLKRHLEQEAPAPVHFTAHDSREKADILVSEEPNTPLPYSFTKFLTISLPMTPVDWDRQKHE